MPGLTEDNSGSMILYALKFIQCVVGETRGTAGENYNNLIL